MSESTIGSVVGGVRLDAEIGRGGMGVVYRGFQTALNRTVAVKVVRGAFADDEDYRARFRRECELAASLEHPHVVPIYSADVDEGRLSVVMRFVDGLDLAAVLGRHGRLSPSYAVELIGQIGSALDAAHRQGLVHRDVKPANILVSSADGRPHAYLTDFGLSRAGTDPRGITGSGVLMGTPEYMAPEQYEASRGPDPRSDAYALGCVLYQCLTGRAPFRQDSAAGLMWAHLSAPPPSPRAEVPTLPPAVDAVVARAMAKRPEERYGSAGEMVRAFRDAVTGPVGSWTPTQSSPSVVRTATIPRPATAPAPWTPGPPPPQQQPPPQPPPPSQPPEPVAGTPRRSRWLTVGVPVAAVLLVAAVVAAVALVPWNRAGSIAGAAISIGRKPLDVEVGAGSVWTANADDGSVSRVDPATGAATTIPVGGYPSQLVVTPEALWVLDLYTSVNRVDLATGTQTEVAGPGAGITAIEGGGGYLWMAHGDTNTVSRIDMATRRLDPLPPVPVGRRPSTLAWVGDTLFVGNADDRTISLIDRSGQQFFPPIVFSTDVGGMEVEGGTVYVVFGDANAPADQARFLTRPVEAASHVVGDPIDLGPASWFEVGHGAGWAAYPFADEIRRIDLQTGTASGDPIEGVGRDVGAMRADGTDLWVTDIRENTLTRVALE